MAAGSTYVGGKMLAKLGRIALTTTNTSLPQVAAGSTYVGGKMLAKLGRIALIAREMGRESDAMTAASRLASLLEVWLDSKRAKSPLLYDVFW